MNIPQPLQHQVTIHLLTPIHIGTGEDLDPFSYVIRSGALLFIDLLAWMEQFPEKARLQSVMASGDFAAARSFIAESFNTPSAVRSTVPVLSSTLLSTYDKAIRKRDTKNQVLINSMTRQSVSEQPYIPGSSVKGALRTAIANQFIQIAGVTKQDATGRDNYDKKIFGAIWEDPMRWLKISDIPLPGAATAIFEAKEFSANPAKPLTPKNHVEAAAGFAPNGRPVALPVRFQLAPFEIHRRRIDLEFIIDALNAFYLPKYLKEYATFYQPARSPEIRQAADALNAVVKSMKSNEALIRIGHFSHVECVTLDGVRNPQTKRGRNGRQLPWGTTRTLANGIYPFGWAIIEFKDVAGRSRGQKAWAQALNDLPVSNLLPQESVDLEKQVRQALENLRQEKVADPIPTEASPAQIKEEGSLPAGKSSQPSERTSVWKKDQAPAPLSKLDKLHAELGLIASNDMGRLGTIIQKIEDLDTDDEKAQIALAIKNKIGKKAFKRHKRQTYLAELIEKGSK